MIMHGKDTSLETVKIVNPKDSKAYLIINAVDFKHGRDVLWSDKDKVEKKVDEKVDEKADKKTELKTIINEEKQEPVMPAEPAIPVTPVVEEVKQKKQPRQQFIPDAPPVQEL